MGPEEGQGETSWQVPKDHVVHNKCLRCHGQAEVPSIHESGRGDHWKSFELPLEPDERPLSDEKIDSDDIHRTPKMKSITKASQYPTRTESRDSTQEILLFLSIRPQN